MDFYNLNKGDWQNFIYLAVILVALLSGLSSRRELGFKKILKYFAIWSFVGLISISLYAYRHEFSDFKNRILGEINPSAARVNQSGQIMINLSEDGHFYINLEINSVPMRFMIDTGASDIVISLAEAERIGINEKKLLFNKPYQTANGTSWGASVIFDELKVGNVKFHNVPASVNRSDMGISLLGMSFLRQFRKYEFYRDQLILTI